MEIDDGFEAVDYRYYSDESFSNSIVCSSPF
jgi:hypothetical protein